MRQINLICAWTMASSPMAAATHIGGSVRGYHDLFALLAAWQIPLRPRRPVRQPVFLCIGALFANVLMAAAYGARSGMMWPSAGAAEQACRDLVSAEPGSWR
jgi:hypothetical protein